MPARNHLIPATPPAAGSWHDLLRAALVRCRMLPGTTDKRAARKLVAAPLSSISARQWAYLLQMAWRYRAQMPAELVPPRELVPPLERRQRRSSSSAARSSSSAAKASSSPAKASSSPRQLSFAFV